MKTTITSEIADLLARGYEMADATPEELHFEPSELEIDFSAPAPAPAPRPPKPTPERTGATEKISIRIPRGTLETVKARARALGLPYQTLLNMQVRAANEPASAT